MFNASIYCFTCADTAFLLNTTDIKNMNMKIKGIRCAYFGGKKSVLHFFFEVTFTQMFAEAVAEKQFFIKTAWTSFLIIES